MKLFGYLPTGYPTVERSIELAELYLKGGCDGIEMSLPYPDPRFEPRNVASAMLYSLWKCNDYDKYFDAIVGFKKKHPEAYTVNLVCGDTIHEVGMDKYFRFFKEADMQCLFGVGLDEEIIAEAKRQNTGISAAIQWQLPDDQIDFALSLDKGVVYLVSKPTPGVALRDGIDTCEKVVQYIKNKGINLPIYAGVGIRTPDDLRRLKKAGVEGAFLGSSLMANFDDEEALIKTINELAEAAHEDN